MVPDNLTTAQVGTCAICQTPCHVCIAEISPDGSVASQDLCFQIGVISDSAESINDSLVF